MENSANTTYDSDPIIYCEYKCLSLMYGRKRRRFIMSQHEYKSNETIHTFDCITTATTENNNSINNLFQENGITLYLLKTKCEIIQEHV
jgi:hypothetical protein